MTDRTASNVIFSDCKDRLLRVPPHALFGAYYAALNHGRLPQYEHNNNHHQSASAAHTPSVVPTNLLAASAFGGAVAGLANVLLGNPESSLAASSSGGNAHAAPHATQYAIFSAIISHPMQQADCERLLLAASKLSASGELLPLPDTSETGEADARRNKLSIASSKRSKTKTNTSSDDLTVSSSTTAPDLITASSAVGNRSGGEDEEVHEEVQVQRTSKPRGASSDKAELRRKWLAVAQRAAALMSNNNNSSSSTHRGSLVAAQVLLEQACALPPYSNMSSFAGSAVVSSTSAANMSTSAVAAANEEAGLLDNVGVLLGKLVKVRTALDKYILLQRRAPCTII